MSHEAINWAVRQPRFFFKDMKPSEQVVLNTLADCHNPAAGCWPGQKYIMEATNLSERAVRDNLDRLRDRGLICERRMRRPNGHVVTRYWLAFEDGFPADRPPSETPPANSAGGLDGSEPPANSAGATGKFCRSHRQNLPVHIEEPVIEPVTEPLREMRASEREDETGPDGADDEDPKAIERAFRRLTKSWPGFGGMPKDRAERAFLDLTPADRAEAERKFLGWLALLKSQHKRHTPGPEAYFRNRLWQDVAEPEDASTPQAVTAKPFGPDWIAARMVWLLRGPKGPAPVLTRIEQALIDKGEFSREALLADKLKTRGWPDVNAMDERAETRQPVTITADLAAAPGAMEAVPVGSAVFEAWRRLHDERGWPWIPDPGALPVVWFPTGGPGRLGAFEAAMSVTR